VGFETPETLSSLHEFQACALKRVGHLSAETAILHHAKTRGATFRTADGAPPIVAED